MQTLVKSNTNTGFILDSIPTPKSGLHEVLIKVLRTSLCGTDLQIYQCSGDVEAGLSLPLVVGHKFVGEIVEISVGTLGYEKGQIVSGETHVACGSVVPVSKAIAINALRPATQASIALALLQNI